jgi:hypothetical protein
MNTIRQVAKISLNDLNVNMYKNFLAAPPGKYSNSAHVCNRYNNSATRNLRACFVKVKFIMLR